MVIQSKLLKKYIIIKSKFHENESQTFKCMNLIVLFVFGLILMSCDQGTNTRVISFDSFNPKLTADTRVISKNESPHLSDSVNDKAESTGTHSMVSPKLVSLTATFHLVAKAATAAKLLEANTIHRPDIIVTDAALNGMEGFTLGDLL
jgi:CheY-like chemotaxis protein